MARGDFDVSWRIVWYGILITAVVGIITFSVYLTQPTWLGLERKAVVNSHQYIESKRGELIRLAQEYNENNTDIERYKTDAVKNKGIIKSLTIQQESLFDRIKADSQLIPEREVPDSVKKILWMAKN